MVRASVEEEIRRNLCFLRAKLEADLFAERPRRSVALSRLLSIPIF